MKKVKGTVVQKMETVKGTVVQKMEKVKGAVMQKMDAFIYQEWCINPQKDQLAQQFIYHGGYMK